MIKFRTKLLTSLLFMLIGSISLISTASAGTSISGNSNVYPGRTYTYTVKATYTSYAIIAKATTGGIFGSQTKTFESPASGSPTSLTASTTITVTVPSSAAIGSTGTISVSGEYADKDMVARSFSGSKTITVVAPPTPPPPTAWELAVREINKTDEGGSITIEMDATNEKEITADIEAFQAIKDRQIVMTVDYGTFKVIIDGKNVGEIPSGSGDINLGYVMLPAERAEDLMVFSPNNTLPFVYAATYAIQPNGELPEDLIYVYRRYTTNPIVEFVNNAGVDDDGNMLIYIFAPGQYIVSSQSIAGTQGNMDMEAFIEMFATPTPEPTPEPTPTPTLSPTPEIVEEDDGGINTVLALSILLGVLSAAFIASLVIFKSKASKANQTTE